MVHIDLFIYVVLYYVRVTKSVDTIERDVEGGIRNHQQDIQQPAAEGAV